MTTKIYFFKSIPQNAYQMSILALFALLAAMPNVSVQAQEVSEIGFIERGRASYFADNRGGIFTASGERYNESALVAAHPYIAFNSYVKVTSLDNGSTVIVRVNDRSEGTNRIIDLSKEAATRLGVIGQLFFDVKIEIIPNPTRSSNVASASEPAYQPGVPPAAETASTQQPIQKPEATVIAAGASGSSTPPAKEEKPQTLEEQFSKVGTYELDGSPVKPLGYGVQVGWFAKVDEAIRMGQRFSNLQFGSIYIQSGWEEGKKAYRVLLGNYAQKDDTKDMVKFLNERHYNAFPRKHYGLD